MIAFFKIKLLSKTLFQSIFTGLTVGMLASCGVEKPAELELAMEELHGELDFNYDVKPILSDKCFACHGPDQKNRKGGLRLDTEEGALAALKKSEGRHAIVPGDLGESSVYARLISTDPELRMPPPESNLKLSVKEVAILTRWIEQGAKYKPHWSLIKPEKPALPKPALTAWAKSPIDLFVVERLEKEGLEPSAEASKEDLIRRASFDLTGLPPTLEEIDRFVSDKSPDAYAKLLDRLLQSPAYGERMASEWMDVSRYADSDGYLDDKHRDFSPWRDWVIGAFNRNIPYNRFVTMQLAGDLIPGKTKESILATAFNRLHKKSSEAGIVFEEYRVEYNADRVQTVSQGILGLSVQCARCHDHKYDPISQEAYYKMFGLFNSTNEIGSPQYGPDQTPGPALLLTNNENEKLLKFIAKQTDNIHSRISANAVSVENDFDNWLQVNKLTARNIEKELNAGLVAYYPFDKTTTSGKTVTTPNAVNSNQPAQCIEAVFKPGLKGNAYFVTDYNSIKLGHKIGWHERTEPFSVDLWINPNTVYPDAGIFYHCEDIRLGYKGYSLRLANNKLQFIIAHSYPQNAIQVSTVAAVPMKKWTRVTVTYDGTSRASGAKIYVDGKRADFITDYDNLYKGILYEKDAHTYGFHGFMVGQRNLLIPFKDGGLDELKIYNKELTALEVLYGSNPEEAVKSVQEPKSQSDKELVKAFYLANFNTKNRILRDSLKTILEQQNALINTVPELMVMGDLPNPRPTYLLNRGVYNAPGKQVTPGALESVLPFKGKFPENRLGLAQWLFDKNNPLTARVFVNRIWQMHFGNGIVKSAADFGNQGNLPSHPQLLDWLAIDFMDSGWNIKRLHKQIMLSATYRQTSKTNPKLIAHDPENTLLARGARFRFTAEMIRDNSLAISGLLVNKLGGKSVYPYQPAGIWDELSDKSWRYKYLQEPGEGLYRRSLYTIWKRTSPPPSMLIFDAPERGECVVKRRSTSTPLQALVLLNDPQHIESARVLAQKVLREKETDHAEPVDKVFRLITGRKPDVTEKRILARFYTEELQRFHAKPADALAYLSTGELDWDKKLKPAEIAALATVSNSIMNTDEGFTRK
ncbi:hypothetical protein DYBT9623_00091 [Dyadobacter sp. CECT 9623]|uniref:Planctomycete cytochrome C n=1 Tax=Dyadobacter linearis TaxID=2823330 RepID=A0ABM8UIU4_9BACT|nr:DUF1553 domain-containing protein [Dyadobacter sp. CECT 9623]CAG5067371.1 hypothetical protein DYBT9623_00091 [Dyadobacter sp. CECT 9623]